MRIVINAMSARYGGGKTYLWNLLEHMEICEDVRIFVLAEPSLALPVRRNVQRVDVGSFASNPFLRSLWERFRLRSLLTSLKADIYFCPGGVLGVRPPEGVQTVVMFRNMLPFDDKTRCRYGLGYMKVRNTLLRRFLLESMSRANLIICVSSYARNIIEGLLGQCKLATTTIHHGIANRFRPSGELSMERPGWLPRKAYLLYVSFMELYKNQIEVVRGYAALRRCRTTPEKLVLVGHNRSGYGHKVLREIRKLGLENDVILTGNVAYEDLPALYHHAAINIFASSCENCPNIMLEAMAAGRPMVVSNQGPMPEFGGDAVLYFDPSDPADLAAKLSLLLGDDKMQSELGKKVQLASSKYDWRKTASATMTAMRNLHLEFRG
jgi:glycosyltransferase involved in cell wall biosynthesis